MIKKLKHVLIGTPLADSELGNEKFNVFWGIPVFASDAISSVSYAGEELLLVLITVLVPLLPSYSSSNHRAPDYLNLLLPPDHCRLSSGRRRIHCRPRESGSDPRAGCRRRTDHRICPDSCCKCLRRSCRNNIGLPPAAEIQSPAGFRHHMSADLGKPAGTPGVFRHVRSSYIYIYPDHDNTDCHRPDKICPGNVYP